MQYPKIWGARWVFMTLYKRLQKVSRPNKKNRSRFWPKEGVCQVSSQNINSKFLKSEAKCLIFVLKIKAFLQIFSKKKTWIAVIHLIFFKRDSNSQLCQKTDLIQFLQNRLTLHATLLVDWIKKWNQKNLTTFVL
jgi:hypothetical protein